MNPNLFVVRKDKHGIFRTEFVGICSGSGFDPNAAVQSLLQLMRAQIKTLGHHDAADLIGQAAAAIPPADMGAS